jgi:hypothetical protein
MRKEEKINRQMFLPPPSNKWRPPSREEKLSLDGIKDPVSPGMLFFVILISVALISTMVGTSLYFILDVISSSTGWSWSFSWVDCLIMGFHIVVIRTLLGKKVIGSTTS